LYQGRPFLCYEKDTKKALTDGVKRSKSPYYAMRTTEAMDKARREFEDH
jgi:hypothetical protein